MATIIQHKDDIKALLEDPQFVEILGIETRDELMASSSFVTKPVEEHFARPWDEKGSGICILQFPKRSNGNANNYGNTVYIAKLFNDEHPFHVMGSEYVPWGNDMDCDIEIGSYKTLGEALDMAHLVHTKGSFQINTFEEDLDQGRYVKGSPSVNMPDAVDLDAQDIERHEMINDAVAKSTATWKEREIQPYVEYSFDDYFEDIECKDPGFDMDEPDINRLNARMSEHALIVDYARDMGIINLKDAPPAVALEAINQTFFKGEGRIVGMFNPMFLFSNDCLVGSYALKLYDKDLNEHYMLNKHGEDVTNDDLANEAANILTNPEVIAYAFEIKKSPNEIAKHAPVMIEFDRDGCYAHGPFEFSVLQDETAVKKATQALSKARDEFDAGGPAPVAPAVKNASGSFGLSM
ncbi:hypothetical protein ACI2KR_06415 [Pseudomonas luteola]